MSAAAPADPAVTDQTVTDPVCGMTVPADAPRAAESGGATYRFCSDSCRAKFLADPHRYLGAAENSDAGAAEGRGAEDAHGCCHGGRGAGSSSPVPPGTAPGTFTCPMHPEVVNDGPGDCPECGMALERSGPPPRPGGAKTVYTCPMHPQIEQDGPGDCPICGMALEPKTIAVRGAEDEPDPELVDMTRRFWVGLALGLPVLLLAMGPMVGLPVHDWIGARVGQWLQLALATPVVLWCGWPFFVRGWKSIVNRRLNMFTLIAIGVAAESAAGSSRGPVACRREPVGNGTFPRPEDGLESNFTKSARTGIRDYSRRTEETSRNDRRPAPAGGVRGNAAIVGRMNEETDERADPPRLRGRSAGADLRRVGPGRRRTNAVGPGSGPRGR